MSRSPAGTPARHSTPPEAERRARGGGGDEDENEAPAVALPNRQAAQKLSTLVVVSVVCPPAQATLPSLGDVPPRAPSRRPHGRRRGSIPHPLWNASISSRSPVPLRVDI